MLRIREVESTQTIGDLRQKIAELEVQVIKKTKNSEIRKTKKNKKRRNLTKSYV